MNKRITVIGGGNLGLACAASLAASGETVTLFTSSPKRWVREVSVEDCTGNCCKGTLHGVTDEPDCVADADIVYLCVPGNVIKDKLKAIKPFLDKDIPVASVFSADGFFFLAEEVLGSEWPVMGFERVPFISRTKIPFRVGGITGFRSELHLAHRNVENPEVWRSLFEVAFRTPTVLLDNFYQAAFANSNPVLHPARVMSLRKQIVQYGPFRHMPLFYEEWDDVASDYAIRLDEELRAVALAKGAHIVPMLEYYESTDAASLTCKMQSIKAFKGIGSPILPDGTLDFSSRYIQADINISVRNIVKHSLQLGLKSPCANEIMSYRWSGYACSFV